MKKLLLSLFALSATSASFAQWTVQNTNLTNGVSRGVQDFSIVDANTVWALGYDGTAAAANVQEFTRTTNGGTTWVSGNIEVNDSDQNLTNISAVSGTTAWVGTVHPTDGFGGVFKTTDGGLNWVQQNPTAYTTAGTLASFFNVVHFFDANTGLTQGDPIGTGVGEFEVYRTTNGGTTWTAVPAAALPNPVSGEYGYNGGNVAAGNSFWFVTNKGKIYRTTDTGVTWTKLDTPITDFSATAIGGSIYFSDNNNGILLARTGPVATATYTLYKTSNGGTSWDAGTPYTQPYRSLSYIPGSTALVGTGVTGTGASAVYTSALSTNNGTTWSVIDTGTQRTSIAFIDGSTGWAGGFTSATGTGGIFKYTGPALSVKDLASATKLKAYPNPVNDVLQLSGASLNEVTVYDILGKQVLSQNFAAQDGVSLNVSSLKAGIYLLNATNDLGATETLKFAKQ